MPLYLNPPTHILHCAAVLPPSSPQVPGVISVSVNLATNTAKVEYDPQSTGPRSCIQAVENAGVTTEAQ